MSSGSIYVCRDPGCPKAQWPLALRAFCWIRDQGSCFLWTSAKISLLLKCFTGSQVLDKGVLNGLHLSSWVKTSAILCCHLSSGLDLGNEVAQKNRDSEHPRFSEISISWWLCLRLGFPTCVLNFYKTLFIGYVQLSTANCVFLRRPEASFPLWVLVSFKILQTVLNLVHSLKVCGGGVNRKNVQSWFWSACSVLEIYRSAIKVSISVSRASLVGGATFLAPLPLAVPLPLPLPVALPLPLPAPTLALKPFTPPADLYAPRT